MEILFGVAAGVVTYLAAAIATSYSIMRFDETTVESDSLIIAFFGAIWPATLPVFLLVQAAMVGFRHRKGAAEPSWGHSKGEKQK